jgi:hypothetical protein
MPHIQTALSYENFSFITFCDRNYVSTEFNGFHGSRLVSGSSDGGGFGSEEEVLEFMAETASKTANKTGRKAIEAVA